MNMTSNLLCFRTCKTCNEEKLYYQFRRNNKTCSKCSFKKSKLGKELSVLRNNETLNSCSWKKHKRTTRPQTT
jgi:hypothetical protein